jgi:glycosyltransferase involved in cell wall biosynthesis
VRGERNVLWVHDLPADMPFMASPKARNEFHGIVFVSSWQQNVFFMNMGVSYSESVVIRNAITPVVAKQKNSDKIRLVYHPTPHRGLQILVPVFVDLCQNHPNLHLDVFSNFDIYDRPQMNETFEPIYDICRKHPNITYHGTQSNDVVRDALASSHIFAYPCIWRETSCISALEAMSAGCLVITPEYAALPETIGSFGYSYPWVEHHVEHSRIFTKMLTRAIHNLNTESQRLSMQKQYVDIFYNWELRKQEWEAYLLSIVSGKKYTAKRGLQWN